MNVMSISQEPTSTRVVHNSKRKAENFNISFNSFIEIVHCVLNKRKERRRKDKDLYNAQLFNVLTISTARETQTAIIQRKNKKRGNLSSQSMYSN